MAAQTKSDPSADTNANQANEFASEFLPFSQQFSKLFAPPAALNISSPKLAQGIADAILLYWQTASRNQTSTASQDFYILDLAPSEGQMAFWLLAALQENGAIQEFKLRYIACCTDALAADTLLNHPHLSQAVTAGQIDAIVFNAENQRSLHLRRQGISLLQIANPLVILGLGFFQSLPSELFASHYGKLLQGEIAIVEEQDKQARLHYQWQALEQAPTMDSQQSALLQYYQQQLVNCAFLFPQQALSRLQQLQQAAKNGYLLLAADEGVCELSMIRMGALYPPEQLEQRALPVNFHALTWFQQQQANLVWHQQLAQDGLVLHAACSQGLGQEASFARLCKQFAMANPTHLSNLAHGIARNFEGGAAAALDLLSLADYAPNILHILLPQLIAQDLALETQALQAWRNALRRSWQHYFPPQQCDGFIYDLALFASHLGDFGLAQTALQQSLSCYGDDIEEHYLLAWCEAQTGANQLALRRLEFVLQNAPEHEPALRLQARLSERFAAWAHLSHYQAALAQDAELSLEPLGMQHASALLYQYRDPHIAQLTRLPELRERAEFEIWLAEQDQEAGRVSYAVLHQELGAIGVVSCQIAQQAGYFYYWIGCDVQQQGFGQRAAQLCFAQMAAAGIHDLYTSVDHCNLHSQYLLEKLGFVRLALQAQAPDDEQYFYYRGQECDAVQRQTGLLKLCEEIAFPLRLESAI